MTATAAWQSSDSTIATINGGGLASGVAPGSVTITATLNSVPGTASLTVTNPLESITVTPANSTMAPTTQQRFTAMGAYFSGPTVDITTSVAWSSSNTSVATVSNAQGLQGTVAAVAHGSTTITASITPNGVQIQGSTLLTVSSATLTRIDVSPLSSTIPLGSQQLFTALGTFSDGTQQDISSIVSWSSSDTTKATITPTSAGGQATGVGVTSTPVTITAANNGIQGTATVSVDLANLVSITITPTTSTLAQGTSRQYTATGKFNNGGTLNVTNQVSWTLTQPVTVASIGLHTGLVKASSVVTSNTQITITATLGTITQSVPLTVTNATPTSVTVTPVAASIPVGTTQDFHATDSFSDGSTQDISIDSTWNSSNTSVATIAVSGRAFGVGAGTTAITATFHGFTSSPVASLTVNAVALVSIAITPSSQQTLAPGSSLTYQATGTYSDGSTAVISALVTWVTSDNTVVSITTNGIATAKLAGTANISASYQQVQSPLDAVLVTASPLSTITVSSSIPAIPVGVTAAFNAIGTFADHSTQNLTSSVTWSSSNSALATVSNTFPQQGFVTGVGTGQPTITAVFAGIAGSTTADITNAMLTQITVSPSTKTVLVGQTQSFTATDMFSDGSSINLTTQVTWTSSSANVATINNAGLASAASSGQTTITATFVQNGVQKSGQATLTVQ